MARKISSQEKMRSVQRVRNGETTVAVARSIGIAESTLRSWLKNGVKSNNNLDERGKQHAIQRVIGGERTAVVAREIQVAESTLRSWVKKVPSGHNQIASIQLEELTHTNDSATVEIIEYNGAQYTYSNKNASTMQFQTNVESIGYTDPLYTESNGIESSASTMQSESNVQSIENTDSLYTDYIGIESDGSTMQFKANVETIVYNGALYTRSYGKETNATTMQSESNDESTEYNGSLNANPFEQRAFRQKFLHDVISLSVTIAEIDGRHTVTPEDVQEAMRTFFNSL